MQYLLLIYSGESWQHKVAGPEREKALQEFGVFTRSIHQSGHLLGSNELDLTSKAATVRVRNGKRMVTDGPFAETKEQLGGYYLIEAKDREEAIAIAARIPSVSWGSIEARPVIPHPMP
jgi:hypothetical protein